MILSRCGSGFESVAVGFERVDDAAVSFGLVGPAALLGVGVELADVGELVAQDGQVFGAGYKVVAGLADVGVGAGTSGQVSGAVAVREPGLEELRGDPVHLGGHDRPAGGGD